MDQSQKFWDRMARGADAGAIELRGTALKTVEATRRHVRAEDVLLDFGCGTGEMSIVLAEHVRAVWGIDTSTGMIEAASARAEQVGAGNVEFVRQTIFDEAPSALGQARFEVVTAFNVLHYVEDVPAVARRIGELLMPGGLFISATVCLGDSRSMMGALLRAATWMQVVPVMSFFKVAALEEMIVGNGSELVERVQLSALPEYLIVARQSAEG